MKSFFKLILSLIVLCGIAVLGSTYYVSKEVEKRFRALSEFAVTESNGLLDIKVYSYDVGLLKSSAITSVTCKIGQKLEAIQVKHTIWNGPVIYTGEKNKAVALELAVIESHLENLPKNYQMDLTTKMIVHYNGEIDAETTMESFSIENEQIKISGPSWKQKTHISKLNVMDNATVEAPSFLIEYKDIHDLVGFENIKISLKNAVEAGKKSKQGVVSYSKMSEKITNLQLSEVDLSWNTTIIADIMDTQWNIQCRELKLGDKTYGPLQLKAEYNHIDETVLRDLLLHQPGVNPMDLLQRFLSKKPTLIIKDTHVSIEAGKIDLDLLLSIGGADLQLPINKETLKATLDGRFKMDLPKSTFVNFLNTHLEQNMARTDDYKKLDDAHKKQALLQQMDLKIKKLKEDGVLVENNDIDTITISIDKGRWVVDGKEVANPVQLQ